jgi:hypothetical protein
MARTLIVALAGAVLALALISLGTYAVVRTTPAGRAISGQSSTPADPWKAIESSYYLFVFGVGLPAVLIAGFLVGLLSRRHELLAALLATSPVSVMASGLALGGLGATVILAVGATGAAYVATRWRSKGQRVVPA